MANSLQDFKNWLQQRHDKIMAAEVEGVELLNHGNKAGYEAKMLEKAEMLKNLSVDARPHLAGLPDDEKYRIIDGLERFSASAQNGIKLKSFFYMSALLWPDEPKAGEPDNLQKFINAL